MRWLLVRDGAVGDTLLALPVALALARAWGPGEALVPGPLLPLLAAQPPFRAVHRLDHPALLPLFAEPPRWPADLGRPELAVVLGAPRLANALRRLGVPVRARSGAPPEGVHQADHLAGVLPELGLPPPPPPPWLVPDRPPRDRGRVWLLPGAGGADRCWPAPHYAALGRLLQARGQRVAVLLGPVERDRGPGPGAFAGLDTWTDLDLPGLAALAPHGVAVGNDAGTTHLLAAAGGRGLVLFGPSDPRRWSPRGGFRVLVGRPLAALAPERVLRELLPMLPRRPSGPGAG